MQAPQRSTAAPAGRTPSALDAKGEDSSLQAPTITLLKGSGTLGMEGKFTANPVTAAASMTRLLRSPILQQYLSAFRDTTGILLRCVPTDIPRNEFTQTLGNDALLLVVMGTRKGATAYINAMQGLIRRVLRTRKPARAQSVHGLAHFAVPITFGESTNGVLIAGPIRQRIPASFNGSNRTQRITPDSRLPVKAVRAFAAMPILSRSQLKSATIILSMIANWVAEHNWSMAGTDEEPHSVARARRFIEEHATDDLAINDVGRHVCLSTDHLGKIFKRHMEMTIGQYISVIRTERVKQMLTGQPCRVVDAAFAAGFQSVAQFNRLFKKYAGVTPGAYRLSARSTFDPPRNSRKRKPVVE